MKATFAIGALLGILALATSAAGSSLAELSATMGTESALSSGAASGASTAHAAMESVIRNIPKPTLNGLADDASSPRPATHGTGTSGWAKPGSSSGGQAGWATNKAGGSNGWVTASTGGHSTTTAWSHRDSASQGRGATSAWAKATD